MAEVLWALVLVAAVAEPALLRTAPRRRLPLLVPWFSAAGRAAVVATAAAVAAEGRTALLLVGVMLITRVGTAYLMGVVRPAMRQSIAATRVADGHFAAWRWADYNSRPFHRLVGIAAWVQVGGDLALAATGLIGEVPLAVYALLAAVAAVELTTHLAGIAQWNRRQAAALRVVAAELAARRPRIVLYTAAVAESVANLEHWLPPLEATGEPCFVLTREPATLQRLEAATSLSIVYVKALGGLEELIPPSVAVALYVDTSVRNNHLLRLSELTHVQLHHGDSDKASSVSRLLRLYDHHLVAGRAAVERLVAAGVIADPAEATIIGRPIAAGLTRRPPNPAAPTVLYAPTWEGYHQDNALSSLPHAAPVLAALLALDHVALEFRPHPLTGRADKAMRGHLAALRELVSQSPRAVLSTDPGADAAIAALERADVLITDVSSMLSDFLYTGRPALVIDGAGMGEAELVARFPTVEAAYVIRSDGSDLTARLEEALGADPCRPAREKVAQQVLGDVDGAAVGFAAALSQLGGGEP